MVTTREATFALRPLRNATDRHEPNTGLGALDRHLFAQFAEGHLGFSAGQAARVLLGMDEAEPALDLPATVAPLRSPLKVFKMVARRAFPTLRVATGRWSR